MEVIILGSGSPLPDSERAGPSTLVRTAAGDLLFDCGRGVLMRAAAAGSGAGAFRALFLTHLHSDHITDLNDVFTMRWVMSFSPIRCPCSARAEQPVFCKPPRRCWSRISAIDLHTMTTSSGDLLLS